MRFSRSLRFLSVLGPGRQDSAWGPQRWRSSRLDLSRPLIPCRGNCMLLPRQYMPSTESLSPAQSRIPCGQVVFLLGHCMLLPRPGTLAAQALGVAAAQVWAQRRTRLRSLDCLSSEARHAGTVASVAGLSVRHLMREPRGIAARFLLANRRPCTFVALPRCGGFVEECCSVHWGEHSYGKVQ